MFSQNQFRSQRNHSPPSYGGALAQDLNGDGLITEIDFVLGARMRGWGPVGEDVARSAFRAFDKNRNGYLDVEDVKRAYGYMHRLYA